MDDLVSQPDDLAIGEEYEQGTAPSGPRRLLRGFGLALVIIALLLAIYGAVAYAAWQRGQSLRVENARQALEEQIANQIELARGDISNGNFALAMRRLDWVLERDPASVEGQTLHEQAQSGLNARLTPTPRPTPTPTPEAVEKPVEESQPGDAFSQEAFTNLETLMNEGRWAAAVSAIAAFQQDFPNERRQETDEMLYNAYMNLGVQMISGTQIELGIFYLSQAERLGDLPLDVKDQQTWAELYLLGIGYYGVDWQTTIFYFQGLCAAAPFYQDACRKLFEAYVAYGDQFAGLLDWCPAEEWYTEAIRLDNVTAVVDKRREAATNCLDATPTPENPITGTLPITNTIPFSNTLPAPSPETSEP
jgi:tetratricopeptide (TPR) repeat protein